MSPFLSLLGVCRAFGVVSVGQTLFICKKKISYDHRSVNSCVPLDEYKSIHLFYKICIKQNIFHHNTSHVIYLHLQKDDVLIVFIYSEPK